MYRKKQRTLFNIDIYSLFDKSLNKSSFVGFLLLKYLNFEDLIKLKKTFFYLGIKIIIPRNKFLRKFLKSNFDKRIFGRLIMVYSLSDLKSLNMNKFLDYLNNNSFVLPLYFYIHNKFMYLYNLLSFKFDKKEITVQLIRLLENHLQSMLNFLTLYNVSLLNLYELYKSIKKN